MVSVTLRRIAVLLVLLANSACSTLVEGRSQVVTVDTIPEGASCVLRSNDTVIGVVPQTPGTLTISKSKYDIIAECTREGYIKARMKNHSDFAVSSLGNFVMLQYSFVGNLIDSATGAANKYDEHMVVSLDREPMSVAAAQPAPVAIKPAGPVVPESERAHQAVPVTPVTVGSLPPAGQQIASAAPAPVVVPHTEPLALAATLTVAAIAPAAEPVLDVTKLSAPQPIMQVAALPEDVHQSLDVQ